VKHTHFQVWELLYIEFNLRNSSLENDIGIAEGRIVVTGSSEIQAEVSEIDNN